MTKKQEKIVVIVGLIIGLILVFGIFKVNKHYEEKAQEEFRLEQEKLIAEDKKEKELEELKKKENEKEREVRLEKKRLEFREQAEKSAEEMKAQGINPKAGTGEVPEPETIKATDNEGNKVTVTKVPKINPNSSPNDVEKPSKKEPTPTEAPKENTEVTKDPTSARDENKDNNNNTTYPNTKPSEENKDNNTNTGKTGNPFVDAPPTNVNSSNSEDLGRPGEPQAGEGDKF